MALGNEPKIKREGVKLKKKESGGNKKIKNGRLRNFLN